ncbi:MAG TPA: LppP/LprE family lipoprotein [Solirubrobacteraceae bacterium]|nr:LppP/LprE family lipoprotein [Solirubrobacteraceae bacterium]
MGRHLTAALAALALGVGSGAALGGCGSGSTKTVSVSGAPSTAAGTSTGASTPSATTQTATTATSATTATATTPASEAGGTAAPGGGTRSAPEPAFTHTESRPEALTQALAVLQARGYSARETSQYHANQTLRVLIGSRGSAQQAFFFLGERYLGTDAKEPSASVQVLSQGDTEVTLGYSLYRDAVATGQQATVRFQLDDGKLAALEPLPPVSSAGVPGRL